MIDPWCWGFASCGRELCNKSGMRQAGELARATGIGRVRLEAMRIPSREALATAILVLGAAVFLPACQQREDEGEPEGEPADRVSLSEKRVFVGNISFVSPKGFVVIKTPTNRRLRAGIPMESFRDGELSAELLFSPEQTVGLMTADISTGSPSVGDDVYLRYTPDFPNQVSPRMQHAIEQHEREQNMGFFERRRYEREKKRKARKKKREREG